jgi:hypothetical protein
MEGNMNKILLTVIICLFTQPAFAICSGSSPSWTAASVAQSDIADCQTVASDGDVITLPSGTATWANKLQITKGVKFRGQSDGSTKIQDYGFSVTTAINNWEISNINFTRINTGLNGGTFNGIAIQIACGSVGNVPSTGWYIHNNSFNNYGTGVITTCNTSTGVIANNYFSQVSTGDSVIYVNGSQNINWAKGSYFGQAGDFVFIEDNEFLCTSGYCGHAAMTQFGGSMVTRCNHIESVDKSNLWANAFDSHGYGHGPASSTALRGTKELESYGNRFTPKGYESFAYNIRGGSARIFNNVWDLNPAGHYSYAAIFFQEYRAETTGQSMQYPTNYSSCSSAAGSCPTANQATCILDHEGYPGCDQVGAGQDSDGGSRQQSLPVYVWNNKDINDADVSIAVGVENNTTIIQQNRDYYVNVAPPGYVPYTYPHPARGLNSTTTCLTDSNSQAKTGVAFWTRSLGVPSNLITK